MTTACSAVVCGPASAAARSGQAGHKASRCRPPDSCLVAPNISKARHRASPAAPSVRETISLGMSESMRDQRMTPGLAPVAFVDLRVPRATEGGKSAKEGKGQDTYGEGGSSGRGGCRGEGKCRHGKQRASPESAGARGKRQAGRGRGREEPETQGRRGEKRAVYAPYVSICI